MAQASDGLSPLQLSGQLNSLPCSLTFRQEETISIIRLIEQVRLSGYWGMVQGPVCVCVGVKAEHDSRGPSRPLSCLTCVEGGTSESVSAPSP